MVGETGVTQLACLCNFFLSRLLMCSGAPMNWLKLLLFVRFDLLGDLPPVLGHPRLGLQYKQQADSSSPWLGSVLHHV